MSGTELIMGMGEVINYLKELEAENKKLQADTEAKEATIRSLSAGLEQYKQENKKLKAELAGTLEELESVQPDGRCLLYEVDTLGGMLDDEREENKKLKEENECVKRQIESVCKANDKLKEEIKELKEEFIDEESESEEEEKTKYDLDDWAYGYGFTVKDGEYRINMAGGGDHWEDYVINKDGCFIHNGCGESQVRTFISSPEGSYVKAVFLADPEYELEEGETDMYEMVQECFIEEIMEYEKEEDNIPTDSDEEPDSP